MNGEMITFNGNGHTYQGYLSKPKSGKGPGIIVIQEWWGLVGHIKDVTDRFAEAGFTAFAPDFYLGETAEEPDMAGKYMMSLKIDDMERILNGAIETLLSNESTSSAKAGVVGFCMGGQLSLYAATINSKIGACVNFYGIHPNVKPNLENLNAPVMGIFAEKDHMTTQEVVKELDKQLCELNKEHTFITYPGTDHAFFNDERKEVYDEKAAKDAWNKVTQFFTSNLS